MKRLGRREFLRGSGVAGGLALLEGCAREEIAYLEQPLDRGAGLPGEARVAKGLCQQCGAGCGLLVRTVDGDAKKLEGDPDHPVNRGGLCALGQSSLQELYHPDRVTAPLRRHGEPGAGAFDTVSWEEALASVGERLRSGRGSTGFVLPGDSGPLGLLWRRFATAQEGVVAYMEPPEMEVERRAAALVFGLDRLPAYDVANSDLVLGLGTAMLDTWRSPVQYASHFAQMRAGQPGRRGRLVQAEARLSLTAAAADAWLPLVPGSEGALARCLAGLIVERGEIGEERLALYRRLFPGPPPLLEEAAARCDVPAAQIARLAEDLVTAERPLVLAGGSAAAQPHGLGATAAGMALNLLLDRLGRPGGVFAAATFGLGRERELGPGSPVDLVTAGPGFPEEVSLRELVARLERRELTTLVVSEADPLHGLPASWGLEAALRASDSVIAIATLLDDTALFADVVLPAQTDLERFAAVEPAPALATPVLGLTGPVVEARGESRHPGDVVLALATSLGEPWSTALDAASFQRFVEGRIDVRRRELPAAGATPARGYVQRALGRGLIWDGEAAPASPGGPPAETAPGRSEEIPDPAAAGVPLLAGSFWLLPFETVKLWSGRGASRPWLQELPDPLSTVMWGSWVEIATADARRLGIATGDRVRLTSSVGSLDVHAVTSPAARPGCLGLPFGGGHRDFGRYARGRGANPWRIVDGALSVEGTEAPAWAATQVRLERLGGGRLPIYGRGLRQAEEIPRGWAPHRMQPDVQRTRRRSESEEEA